jgi:hypothetical protein
VKDCQAESVYMITGSPHTDRLAIDLISRLTLFIVNISEFKIPISEAGGPKGVNLVGHSVTVLKLRLGLS